MKQILYYGIGMVLTAAVAGGCASTGLPSGVTVEPVRTLMADSSSHVHLNLTFRIPQEMLSKRSRLIVVPQLVQQDSVWDEYRPLALDAPIYTRKMKRRQRLHGYVDSLAAVAVQAKRQKEYLLPYQELITLPPACVGGRIVAVLSSDGCGECGQVDSVDMAYLSSTPHLISRPTQLRTRWMERPFVVRPKIMEGRGEARLQFTINRHHIDLNLGRNREEMNDMLTVLGNIVHDSLATLHHVKIDGMASADGSLPFNTLLSAHRAAAAKQWLVNQLHLPRRIAACFQVGSRPEGWQPVWEAMRADAHPDTLLVQKILERYAYANDDVAERYIRRLPCWNDIKNRYLQKDRKVVYEYAYTLKSFTTDKELLQVYHSRPDAFNEDELLRVSSLQTSPREQAAVYRTLLHFFPQSHIAANNLAVLLLADHRYQEAEQVLTAIDTLDADMRNTLAVCYIYQQKYAEAIDTLLPLTSLEEARYNVGEVYAWLRQWNHAFRWLKEFHTTQAALVSLCVNETDHAAYQMKQCTDRSPKAAYVRALIHARRGEKEAMLQALAVAVTDATLCQRAAGDVEFKAYEKDTDFLSLLKGDTRS